MTDLLAPVDSPEKEICPRCNGCGEHDASGAPCMGCCGAGVVDPEPAYYTQPAEAILGDSVICDQCGSTLATYADTCAAELGKPCPGFAAIERAVNGVIS